jgi:hypothetical protein
MVLHLDAAAVGNDNPTAKGELMMQKVNHEIAIICVQRLVDVTGRQ